MKTWSALIGLCCASSPLLAWAQVFPAIEWQVSFGGSGANELKACLLTTDGGFLVGGDSDSPPSGNKAEPNSGGSDFWVLKLDAGGNKQWERGFGGYMDDRAYAVVAAGDAGFLAGGSTDSSYFPTHGNITATNHGAADFWIVRIGPDGGMLWDRCYGGVEAEALQAIVPADDGGYLLAGWSKSPVGGNKTASAHGKYDLWAVKVDASGQKMWDQSYGGGNDDYCNAAVATADGGYLLAGTSYSGVSGNKTAPSCGWADVWVVKIHRNGAKQWDRAFGGGGAQSLQAMVSTPDGGVLLGGMTDSTSGGNKSAPSRGDRDMWVFKLDSQGNKQWDQTYGGSLADQCWAIAPVAGGGFLLGGPSGSPADGNKSAVRYGNSDYWIVRIDGSGNKLWDQAYGGSSSDILTALVASGDGGFLLAGQSSSLPSGTKTAPQRGAADYWLLKVAGSLGPSITTEPQSVTVSGGRDVDFGVVAFSAQSPLRYQWRFGGKDIPGALGSTLLLTNVQPTMAGAYTVLVSNDFGSVESHAAVLTYTDAADLEISIHPSVRIYGTVGKTYRIEYTEDLTGVPQWTVVTNLTLATTPQLFVDVQAATLPKRLYRVVLQP